MTAQKATCFVTTVLDNTKGAFALREDNGEGVFISGKTADAVELESHDTISAILVPNQNTQQTSTPWFCVSAQLLEDE